MKPARALSAAAATTDDEKTTKKTLKYYMFKHEATLIFGWLVPKANTSSRNTPISSHPSICFSVIWFQQTDENNASLVPTQNSPSFVYCLG